MNIDRATAVLFLVALGFNKAEEWDNDKLQTRLGEVPSRLTIEAVPEKMHDLYNELAKAVKDKEDIVVEAGDEGAASEEKPAKKAKGKGAKAAKAEKPAKKEKKAKKEKAPKKERERDAFGAAVGTNRAKINAALSDKFQTDAEIAKAAGVTVRQARLHCRRLVRGGAMEKLKTIAYRLAAKPAKKAKEEPKS